MLGAECKLTRYLTKALPRVREICHVDIDGDLLSRSGRNAEPLFVDLIQQREETPVGNIFISKLKILPSSILFENSCQIIGGGYYSSGSETG